MELTARTMGVPSRIISQLFRKPKYPRKLKKAIRKAWNIEECNGGYKYSFCVKSIRNPKLNLKVQNMITIDKDGMEFPLWNGERIRVNMAHETRED